MKDVQLGDTITVPRTGDTGQVQSLNEEGVFIRWPEVDTPQLIVWETWEKMLSSGAIELTSADDDELEPVMAEPVETEPDETEGGSMLARDLIDRVLAGQEPDKVVEVGLMGVDDEDDDEEREAFVREMAAQVEQGKGFATDPEKSTKLIKSLELPKDGFFRACVSKVSDEITDKQKFCGALKAFAVDKGLANPG